MKYKAFRAAFPYTVPVLFGYIFLGIAFGVSLVSQGFPFYIAVIMSLIIYAGSMQFVAISVLTAGFNLIGAAIITLTVNARHLFYGLSMLDKYRDMKKLKPYMIFSLTDETYSLLCSADPPAHINRKWFYFFISVLDQSYWVIGTLIGAVAGSVIPFNSTGIDFAMTALFVVIFVEQWESQKNHIPAIAGVVIAFICLLIFGPDNFIIASMIGILAILILGRRHIKMEVADK